MQITCKKCLKDKDSLDFHIKRSRKTGYQAYCKNCSKQIQKDFYVINSEKILERKRIYRESDSYKTNSKKYEITYKERRNDKRKKNFKIKFGLVLREMVRRCLNGNEKQANTFKILGYDTTKLKQRLEFQFKDGISWENYGEWHIDHKKPISKFKNGTNINIINALSNLQPLWAKDNLSKGNKF